MSTQVSRRTFLRFIAIGSAAVGSVSLSGCYAPGPSAPSQGASTPAPTAAAAAKAAATQAPATKERVTIRFMDWHLAEEPMGSAVRETVKLFQEANSNVTVELEPTPHDQMLTRVATQGKAGAVADVVHSEESWLANLANEGFIIDLEGMIEKEGGASFKKQFSDRIVGLGTFGAKLYGIPAMFSALLLEYNAELSEKAGLDPNTPPATWPEYLDYAKKLTKPDGTQFGVSLMGKKQLTVLTRFTTWLFNNGTGVLSEDGKTVQIGDAKAIETLDFWSSLVLKHGVVPPGVPEVDAPNGRSLFAQERVAMFQNASAGAYIPATENPKIRPKIRVAPMPTQIGKAWTPQFGDFMTIATNSKYKDVAWDLIKFYSSKESWLRTFKASGFTPWRNDVLNDPIVQADPVGKVASQMTGNVRTNPSIPKWPQVGDVALDAIQLTLGRAKTPEQAFKDAAEAITRILNA